jgi:L-aspartate oxidase
VQLLSAVLIHGAQLREESRGGHWRSDFPDTSPAWTKRIVTTMTTDGTLAHTFAGLEDTP